MKKDLQNVEAPKRSSDQKRKFIYELMETVKYCSIGQITHALYEVGGQYRRICDLSGSLWLL